MSNLSGVAAATVKNHRMNITLGVGQGSRASRAAEADRLSTPRKIKLTGAVEGEGMFDGSDDVLIYTMGDVERDYRWVKNKPQINGVELVGNKTSEELGVQPAGEYADTPINKPEIDEIIDRDPLDPDDPGADPLSPADIDEVIDGPVDEDEDAKAMTNEDIDEIFDS